MRNHRAAMSGELHDPWELTPEEIDERLARIEGDDVEARALRAALGEAFKTGTRAVITTEALADMPSSLHLHYAIKALTGEECRWALHVMMRSVHALRMTPEQLEEWSAPGAAFTDDSEPELRPDDD